MKIAVIGAGLAGLTCALRLQQAGQDVFVFEARKRVGGRVYTVNMKEPIGRLSPVEMGGQNITDGGLAHNFRALADEFNLSIEEKTLELNLAVFHEGAYFSYDRLLEDYPGLEKTIVQRAPHAPSIAALIDAVLPSKSPLNNALKTRMQAYEGVHPLNQSIYHNVDTLLCAVEGGIAASHQVYQTPNNEIRVGGLRDGNAALAEAMARSLEDRVHLEKVLTRIDRTPHAIKLSFKDGQIIEVDRVVIALPIAVLQEFDLTHWGMDTQHAKLIKGIESGQNYKVAIPVQSSSQNAYQAVLGNQVISFFSFDNRVLFLYATETISDLNGTLKIALEGFGIKEESTPLISSILTDTNFEEISTVVEHNWQLDPFARCSYTGYGRAVSMELDKYIELEGISYKSLFVPIDQKVFFAGEHTTILECIGTMEAAVESGERIARGVLASIHGRADL
jgi:monoamine oxidase